MSWGVKVPFLSENVIRCVPLLGLPTSGLFSLIARCPVGPTVSIAFWSKFCPVDFNRDSAACLIFLRQYLIPFLKPHVLGSLLPFSTKAWLL